MGPEAFWVYHLSIYLRIHITWNTYHLCHQPRGHLCYVCFRALYSIPLVSLSIPYKRLYPIDICCGNPYESFGSLVHFILHIRLLSVRYFFSSYELILVPYLITRLRSHVLFPMLFLSPKFCPKDATPFEIGVTASHLDLHPLPVTVLWVKTHIVPLPFFCHTCHTRL